MLFWPFDKCRKGSSLRDKVDGESATKVWMCVSVSAMLSPMVCLLLVFVSVLGVSLCLSFLRVGILNINLSDVFSDSASKQR